MKAKLSVIKNSLPSSGERAQTVPRDLEDLPLFLTPPQIAEMLQSGRSSADKLVRSKGFSAVKIGRSVRVYKEALKLVVGDSERYRGVRFVRCRDFRQGRSSEATG